MKKYSKFTFLLPWFICALGALFYSYEYFLRITPSVMIDDLQRFFNIDAAMLGSLSAFYYFIYTPMQLPVGVLMDRYGPRRLLTLAALACAAGSFLFGATKQLGVAEMGRLLIGFGSAFSYVGVLKLATIWLPQRYFGMFTGFAIALGMTGAIVGNETMTALVSSIGWRMTVFISAGFGIGLAILIGLFVRDSTEERPYKLVHNTLDMRSALLSLWRIAKNPQMWIIGLVGCLTYAIISAFAELWCNDYLMQAFDFSPADAAFATSLVFASWIIGAPLAGWISDTIKRRCLPITIGSFLSVIFFILLLYLPHLSKFDVYILLFFAGFFSSVEALVFPFARDISPPKAYGSAIAFVNMLIMLGGVILQPLIGKILDNYWTGATLNDAQVFSDDAFRIALIVIPIGLVVCGLLSQFVLRETYCGTKKKKELNQKANEALAAV